MLDAQEVEKRHEEMRALKQREEPALRDIARIIRPDDQDFSRNSQTDRDNYDVFDSAPLYALDDFAAGMFTENTNPAERWMELTIADKDLAKWGPVQAWLWGEASLTYASLSPAASNFYPEATGWFGNVGAFGNAFLYQEEWLERKTIIDRNIPIGEAFFDVDAAGNLDGFNREYGLTGRQKKARFGEKYVGANCRDDSRYTIIHSVYRNPDFKPGMLGPRGMPFASTYISPDNKNFRVDGGYYELPYHALFWNKRSGRPWATGPGHNARADMNMLNEQERSNMVDAQFAAEPPILTHKEGLFSSADIQPNAILEGALNEKGQELIKTLQRGDNPQRAETKTDQKRAAIREAFYFSMLQVQGRPQMTATEFMGWKEERLRQLGPYLVRIQQGLASFIARRYRILARAGQTNPMPPELKGHNIAVEFVSPLAKAQKLATGRAVMQWVGSLGQIAEFSKDPSVFDVVNKDGAARTLHDAMVGTPDVINDQRQVATIRQARVQQQAQQAQLEQAAQGASIVADVAHASQAMTLSKQRTGAGK